MLPRVAIDERVISRIMIAAAVWLPITYSLVLICLKNRKDRGIFKFLSLQWPISNNFSGFWANSRKLTHAKNLKGMIGQKRITKFLRKLIKLNTIFFEE